MNWLNRKLDNMIGSVSPANPNNIGASIERRIAADVKNTGDPSQLKNMRGGNKPATKKSAAKKPAAKKSAAKKSAAKK